MARKSQCVRIVCVLAGLLVVLGGTVRGNWFETFDNNKFDLSTWKFLIYPDLTKTFQAQIKDDPNGTDYLALSETSSVKTGGSAFGAGFGSEEAFTDVRIGAVVNVLGDASHNYYGLAGRTNYFIDDGKATGAPGFIATQTYVMHVNWEYGPANMRIDIEKVINMQNIMRNEETLGLDIPVQGLAHARSYYAELDIVGSDPTYVTGSLYEFKGGPLVARTATMVDTKRNDPWEDEGAGDAPFQKGISGIFGQNEKEQPAGYYVTFDEVFSISDGPSGVISSPADGAKNVPIDVTLNWIEAAFAKGRDVWLGKDGAMEKVASPTGKTYTHGNLELGQTYQWRIDQIGPAGPVEGHTWTFTTANYLIVDDFESYADDAGLRAAWVDNINDPGVEYVFLGAGANKAMRFEFQNQYEPYFTEVARTFASPQDWTAQSVETISLSFVGEHQNAEHLMYMRVEDASGKSFTVAHPYKYACQSDSWRQWTIPLGSFADGGVNLTTVKKITIGLGDGTSSGQAEGDRDHIYIDQIVLNPAAASK